MDTPISDLGRLWRASICALAACLVMQGTVSAQDPAKYATGVAYRGINQAGLEYGNDWYGWQRPGLNVQPTEDEVADQLDFFKSRGMNVIRLPISWEKVQPSLGGELAQPYLGWVKLYVDAAKSRQMSIIIDLHNYNRYAENVVDANGVFVASGFTQRVLGDGTLTFAHLADVWVKLTNEFLTYPNVMLGLMNEPHYKFPGEPADPGDPFDVRSTAAQWFAEMNTLIAAIRATGSQQLILVPRTWGSDVTYHWAEDSAADAALALTDSANNYAFDLHHYWSKRSLLNDNDPSNDDLTYVDFIAPVTQWAQTHGMRLFLSELGVPSDEPNGQAAVTDLLNHLDAHASVWMGWTPWNLSPYFLTPTQNGRDFTHDGPSMAWYTTHLDPAVFTVSGLAAEMQQMLDEHNADRAQHCAAPLTWDEALAAEAQSWAETCTATHSSGGGYGENLYYGWPSASATQAEDWWYNEVAAYDFNNPGFSAATGHFTQIVWRGSTQLGCGKASCPNLDPTGGTADYWVCRYAPAGNITNPGQFEANVFPVTAPASCTP